MNREGGDRGPSESPFRGDANRVGVYPSRDGGPAREGGAPADGAGQGHYSTGGAPDAMGGPDVFPGGTSPAAAGADGAVSPGAVSPGAISPGAAAQQARDAHDRGGFGDKIPGADPATSPLGTDSEAAGTHIPEGAAEPRTMSPPLSDMIPSGHAKGIAPSTAKGFTWAVAAAVVLAVVALAVYLLSGDPGPAAG